MYDHVSKGNPITYDEIKCMIAKYGLLLSVKKQFGTIILRLQSISRSVSTAWYLVHLLSTFTVETLAL